MKLFQIKFKTLLLLLFVGFSFCSCGNEKKDNKTKNELDSSSKQVNKASSKKTDKDKRAGDKDHSIDIELAKGSKTIEYSDAIPNDEGNALYKNSKQISGGRKRTITTSIGDYNDDKPGIFGIFRVDENLKPLPNFKQEGEKLSTLLIRTNETDDYYQAISGTLSFSNLKFALILPNNGAACFTLEFEGEFQKNNDKKDIYQGSGKIVLSPKSKMGVYKKKLPLKNTRIMISFKS